MSKFFDYNDIQKFLLTRGIYWNGVRLYEKDALDNEPILAVIKPSDSVGSFVAKMDIDEVTFKITQEEMHFSIYEMSIKNNLLYDFSLEWMVNLIKKNPELAEVIKEKAADNIEQIRMRTADQIAPYQAEIDKIENSAKEEIDYWKRIEVMADEPNSVSQSDKEELGII